MKSEIFQIIFSVVIISVYLIDITYGAETVKLSTPQTDKKAAAKQATFFCDQFDIKKNFIQKGDEYKKCKALAVLYFEKIQEPETSITEYIEYCKAVNYDYYQSIQTMNYLVDLGWDMKNAIDLLKGLNHKDYFQEAREKSFPKFTIKFEDWFEYKFSNFSLEKCVNEFLKGRYKSDDYTVFITSLKDYKTWYYSDEASKKSVCDCNAAIGIGYTFYVKSSSGIEISKKTEIYNQFCLNAGIKYKHWSLQQYIEMAKELSFDDTYKFLKNGFLITIGGWFEKGVKSRWPITSIVDYIGLNNINDQWKNEFKNRIKLTNIALQMRFGDNDFKDYVQITDKEGGIFATTDCKYDVLSSVLFMKYQEAWPQHNDYAYYNHYKASNNYKFWERFPEHKFLFDYLTMLMDAFKKEPIETNQCANFANLLIQIEQVIGLSTWNQVEVVEKIKTMHDKSLKEIYENLKEEYNNQNPDKKL